MKTAAGWRAGVATDPGLRRSTNEDRVFVDDSAGIFLVVDGVGGQAAGEKAAEIAVQVISRHLPGADGSEQDRVRRAIAAANNEIYRIAQGHPDWRGMACVLTLAFAHDDRITVGHVGDSRLYLAWDGRLRKLTSDHSPVGEREDQGELTESQAMKHPRRHEVFRDVGSRPRESGDDDFIEIRSVPFHPDAAFLLCSDGLTDVVPASEINAIIETYDGDPEGVARQLVDAANQLGGKDNISVVFVAGPEFAGISSRGMREARARHAITRMRRTRARWKTAAGHLIWLLTGVLVGILLWDIVDRVVPRQTAAQTHPSSPLTPAAPVLVGAGDPRAVAQALAAAHPGDTILVQPGQYLGPLELRDGVNLISQKPGQAVIRVDAFAGADPGIAIAAHGVRGGRISGFRVLGDTAAPMTTGLLLDRSTVEVEDLEIAGATDCGVRVEAGSAGVLRANWIHGNNGCGVWIGGESAPRLAGNRISDNGLVSGAERPGVEIHPPAVPVIENNIVTGNGATGFGALPASLENELRRGNIVDGDVASPPAAAGKRRPPG